MCKQCWKARSQKRALKSPPWSDIKFYTPSYSKSEESQEQVQQQQQQQQEQEEKQQPPPYTPYPNYSNHTAAAAAVTDMDISTLPPYAWNQAPSRTWI